MNLPAVTRTKLSPAISAARRPTTVPIIAETDVPNCARIACFFENPCFTNMAKSWKRNAEGDENA